MPNSAIFAPSYTTANTGGNKLLGHIIPVWTEPSIDVKIDVTTIKLPAKKGQSFESGKLVDVCAGALLFLRRLKSIEINDEKFKINHRREDEGGLTVLMTETMRHGQSEETIEEELFLRSQLSVDMKAAPDEMRKNSDGSYQTSSEIALAFPIQENRQARPNINSKIYAFLPIRKAGFKFAIHADFVLGTSREDINASLAWNKQLISYIAQAFCQSVESFKSIDGLNCSYLEYIPGETEVHDDVLQPVRQQIIKKLSVSKCLLSSDGTWSQPSDLRFADSNFRQLFPTAFVRQIFGFDYLDLRLEKYEPTLRKLGVKDVSPTDVVSIFKNHSEWLKAQSKPWISRFFLSLPMVRSSLFAADC